MDPTFTLAPEQRAAFDRDGVLHLPGFYHEDLVRPMAEAISADLGRRRGYDKARPETWTLERPSHFQAVSRSGAFAGLSNAKLKAVGDAILGAGRWREAARPGPVVSFPAPPWALPHRDWHLDLSAAWPPEAADGPSALRVFTLLGPVAPRSGGTVMLAGSHRLALAMARETGRKVHSAELRERLRSESGWYAMLESRARDPGFEASRTTIRGVELRFEEICGRPGDVVLMHPNTLHAGTSNGAGQPRMMTGQTLVTSAFRP